MRLLSDRSPFFKSYFARAADSSRLDLPSDDPAAFAIVAQWIYQLRLPRHGAIPATGENLVSGLYCLAGNFGLKKLQDELLAGVAESYLKVRSAPTPWDREAIAYIYEHTTAGSPFRLFGIDALAYCYVYLGLDVVELRPLFVKFPELAGDFITAVKETRADGQDFQLTRARQRRRYVH